MERTERPPKIRPPMDVVDRAKLFAPFAALGSMEAVLKEVEENRDVGDYSYEAIIDEDV
ncbi:MAG: hypothetical protein HUJ75_00620 [Parasporobacterium sp.]|nr:hypothetical protein [Parasporobacterium sp.]